MKYETLLQVLPHFLQRKMHETRRVNIADTNRIYLGLESSNVEQFGPIKELSRQLFHHKYRIAHVLRLKEGVHSQQKCFQMLRSISKGDNYGCWKKNERFL